MSSREFGGWYEGEHLNRVAFPLGGLGAGMVAMEGTGAFSHVSLRHRPDVFKEPLVFAALAVKSASPAARVIEGPVPRWRVFGAPQTGLGMGGTSWGLPRFGRCRFLARFPFATVEMSDESFPLAVEVSAWSPFIPGNSDDSSLPVAGVEYRIVNTSNAAAEAVFSMNARNFMAAGQGGDFVGRIDGGFVLGQKGSAERPWDEGAFAAFVDSPDAKIDCAWFRGGWFDALTQLWGAISSCEAREKPPIAEGAPSPGGSVSLPLALAPDEERTVRVMFAWYLPKSDVRCGAEEDCGCGSCKPSPQKTPGHEPWYAGRYDSVNEVAEDFRARYEELRSASARFRDGFYDSKLPPEAIEAAAANLTILKSPTVLRQKDGRIWAWEGCCDSTGCCHGTCTHVWNYAQAICHLFPDLERGLRETEHEVSQDERGHQNFRTSLPIRPPAHDHHAAADGQLGGVMKVHREWRISGDLGWLKRLWPGVRRSLDYCIETWDPNRQGALVEPHHNTYDIEFWGPNGMCQSIYLGALKAAEAIALVLGEDAGEYRRLYELGRRFMEERLWNGEYFEQDVRWKGLRAKEPAGVARESGKRSPEEIELLEREGPRYQYGAGCLSDGVIGAWLAECCGVGEILDPAKVKGHLQAVYRHNFKRTLKDHVNTERPTYALGDEAALVCCTWPRGGRPSIPFPYCDEAWTGIEYQVASHMIMCGMREEGLEIVRAVRKRYDGVWRNPFNEYECGHWYARAMASYALLQAFSGARWRV